MSTSFPIIPFSPLTSASTFSPSSSSNFHSKLLKTSHPAPLYYHPYPASPPPFPCSFHFRHGCVGKRRRSLSTSMWLCGFMTKDQYLDNEEYREKDEMHMLGMDDEVLTQIPTQAQSVVEGSSAVLVSEFKPSPDVDYIQELLAIQQQGPRAIGFFGTRNMGFMHQELIEILSYAMIITKNHIYTSGASGTNSAVIRGALRAEKPELLTVILPQSLKRQPPESQDLLSKVKNVIEKPYNDHLPLIEASRYVHYRAKTPFEAAKSDGL